MKLTVQRLEKKLDSFIAVQPESLDENYIAEYVTSKVEELFADVEQGPLSGIVAVMGHFEAILTGSTHSEDQRGNLLIKRHEDLQRKTDTILANTDRLAGTESSLHSGSTVSQQIINEITPMLQQTVTTTVLQQVSAEVRRTMQEFWLNLGGNGMDSAYSTLTSY